MARAMPAKILIQENVKKINLCQAIFAPPQSCAHGMCHACHTLDTPLIATESFSTFYYDAIAVRRLSGI